MKLFIKNSINYCLLFVLSYVNFSIIIHYVSKNINALTVNSFMFAEIIYSISIFIIIGLSNDIVGLYMSKAIGSNNAVKIKIIFYQNIFFIVLYIILFVIFYIFSYYFLKFFRVNDEINIMTYIFFINIIPGFVVNCVNTGIQNVIVNLDIFYSNIIINVINTMIIIYSFKLLIYYNFTIDIRLVCYIKLLTEIIFLLLNILILRYYDNYKILSKIRYNDFRYHIWIRAKYFFTNFKGSLINNSILIFFNFLISKSKNLNNIKIYSIILNIEFIIFCLIYSLFISLRKNVCVLVVGNDKEIFLKQFNKLKRIILCFSLLSFGLYIIFSKYIIGFYQVDNNDSYKFVMAYFIMSAKFITKYYESFVFIVLKISFNEKYYYYLSKIYLIISVILYIIFAYFKIQNLFFYLIFLFLEDFIFIIGYSFNIKNINFDDLFKQNLDQKELI